MVESENACGIMRRWKEDCVYEGIEIFKGTAG